MLISAASAYIFHWPTFKQQDVNSANSNASRIYNELNNQIDNLHLTAGDWSAWDDTKVFVDGGNLDYPGQN
jgi:sensor domain CHASE-containing protein